MNKKVKVGQDEVKFGSSHEKGECSNEEASLSSNEKEENAPGSIILQTQLFEEAHLTGGNTRFCRESGRCSDYMFLTQMCPL